MDSGNSGQFVDKPWLAVDVPRPGAKTCLLPTSPGAVRPGRDRLHGLGALHRGAKSTKVMLSRSLDCGATWSQPTKLSESDSINQGLTMAIDPASGELYVAWRRFAAPQAAGRDRLRQVERLRRALLEGHGCSSPPAARHSLRSTRTPTRRRRPTAPCSEPPPTPRSRCRWTRSVGAGCTWRGPSARPRAATPGSSSRPRRTAAPPGRSRARWTPGPSRTTSAARSTAGTSSCRR